MKTHKIIISTLALAMGAALAGSVSGTVAWFQYSTRAQATFIGTTAHCSEALEVSVGDAAATDSSTWKTELGYSEIDSGKTADCGTSIEPITSGEMAQNGALPANFYKNPVYQYAEMSKWGTATIANYVQFKLHFHVKDINSSDSYLANHNLYLTNLSIVSLTQTDGENPTTTDVSASNDIYKAIRVHISASGYNALFAAGTGTDGVITTATHGALDLNNDGEDDQTAGYEWNTRSDVDYGVVTPAAGESPAVYSGNQLAYEASSTNFADDTDPTAIVNTLTAPKKIGSISNAVDGLSVTVTIWLEGWQELNDGAYDGSASKVWDPSTYVGQKFGVGFRFATELHGVTGEHGA